MQRCQHSGQPFLPSDDALWGPYANLFCANMDRGFATSEIRVLHGTRPIGDGTCSTQASNCICGPFFCHELPISSSMTCGGLQVSLQYESDAWMMVTTDSGRSGLVPSSFLNILTQNSPFSQPFNQVSDHSAANATGFSQGSVNALRSCYSSIWRI